RFSRDWSSDVCSSDLNHQALAERVEVVALARKLFLRERERIDDAAAAGAERSPAQARQLRVDEADVERGVVDDDLGAVAEGEEQIGRASCREGGVVAE